MTRALNPDNLGAGAGRPVGLFGAAAGDGIVARWSVTQCEKFERFFTDLRESGKFAGHALETLLITPPEGTVAARRVLLIGLGNRKEFTPELLRRVGAVGMREAVRLGVTSYAHASDLKDGVDSPTAAVASAVVTGALDALATERYLADKGAGPRPSVAALTLLAGPSFFAQTTAAVRETLAPQVGR